MASTRMNINHRHIRHRRRHRDENKGIIQELPESTLASVRAGQLIASPPRAIEELIRNAIVHGKAHNVHVTIGTALLDLNNNDDDGSGGGGRKNSNTRTCWNGRDSSSSSSPIMTTTTLLEVKDDGIGIDEISTREYIGTHHCTSSLSTKSGDGGGNGDGNGDGNAHKSSLSLVSSSSSASLYRSSYHGESLRALVALSAEFRIRTTSFSNSVNPGSGSGSTAPNDNSGHITNGTKRSTNHASNLTSAPRKRARWHPSYNDDNNMMTDMIGNMTNVGIDTNVKVVKEKTKLVSCGKLIRNGKVCSFQSSNIHNRQREGQGQGHVAKDQNVTSTKIGVGIMGTGTGTGTTVQLLGLFHTSHVRMRHYQRTATANVNANANTKSSSSSSSGNGGDQDAYNMTMNMTQARYCIQTLAMAYPHVTIKLYQRHPKNRADQRRIYERPLVEWTVLRQHPFLSIEKCSSSSSSSISSRKRALFDDDTEGKGDRKVYDNNVQRHQDQQQQRQQKQYMEELKHRFQQLCKREMTHESSSLMTLKWRNLEYTEPSSSSSSSSSFSSSDGCRWNIKGCLMYHNNQQQQKGNASSTSSSLVPSSGDDYDSIKRHSSGNSRRIRQMELIFINGRMYRHHTSLADAIIKQLNGLVPHDDYRYSYCGNAYEWYFLLHITCSTKDIDLVVEEKMTYVTTWQRERIASLVENALKACFVDTRMDGICEEYNDDDQRKNLDCDNHVTTTKGNLERKTQRKKKSIRTYEDGALYDTPLNDGHNLNRCSGRRKIVSTTVALTPPHTKTKLSSSSFKMSRPSKIKVATSSFTCKSSGFISGPNTKLPTINRNKTSQRKQDNENNDSGEEERIISVDGISSPFSAAFLGRSNKVLKPSPPPTTSSSKPQLRNPYLKHDKTSCRAVATQSNKLVFARKTNNAIVSNMVSKRKVSSELTWTRSRLQALDVEIQSLSSTSSSSTLITTTRPVQLTKDMLATAQFIAQLDNKYIIVIMDGILCAVDQHAADERVGLERLERALQSNMKAESGGVEDTKTKKTDSVTLSSRKERKEVIHSTLDLSKWKDIQVKTLLQSVPSSYNHREPIFLSSTQTAAIKDNMDILNKWKFEFAVDESSHRLSLQRVPAICDKVATSKDFLQFVHVLGTRTLNTSASLVQPAFVKRVLASLACRYAIMFGDVLPDNKCEDILSSLSECDLSFICAHGRPSVVPLLDMNGAKTNEDRRSEESDMSVPLRFQSRASRRKVMYNKQRQIRPHTCGIFFRRMKEES